MRTDLLALSSDDLTAFSNRGLTRRAEQEAANPSFTCTIAETPEGHVNFGWSDGVTCNLRAGARVSEFRCSCSSTTLCRHILRSVFAYQRQHRASLVPSVPETPTSVPVVSEPPAIIANAPWNPGSITDEALAQFYPVAEFARLKREFDSGHVLQVSISAKPRAQLHTLGCTVNFLVPHDARYAACDCSKEAPCAHVALAVWAFRKLPTGQSSGLISTAAENPSAPIELLDAIEAGLVQLANLGLARTSSLQVDQWRRLSSRALDATLVWPAEVLAEMAELHAAYLSGDARFDPREFVALLAELVQRMDAIRKNRTPVPALFVRGSAYNRETEMGAARLIGLGCGVRPYRGGVQLVAYLQDNDSGGNVAVLRRFPDPEKTAGNPKTFAELGATYALKGAHFAALGRGQLLVKGGRRTPSGQFLPGRAPLSVSPQAYQWEQLRTPLRVAGFSELREQLKAAPPATLAPRQAGARLTVCPLVKASQIEFEVASQQIVAKIEDAAGESAWLVHPYRSRAASGSERLLHALRQRPDQIGLFAARLDWREHSW